MEKGIQLVYDGILEGDMSAVSENVISLLSAGVEPKTILDEGLIAAMGKVGELFENGDFFVPEMLVAARAMKAGLEILKPKLVEAEVESKGRVVIGTVKGDLHDIGKNLVSVMLEGAGFDIVDLGVDITADQFVEAVKAGGVDVLAMSALLTTTMPGMQTTIAALEAQGLRDQVKVIIGGAPVTQKYADEIGADGFAADAGLAVTLTKSLLA
jgi:5-methyltetrahydrofolate--homocysteine methyltransferase